MSIKNQLHRKVKEILFKKNILKSGKIILNDRAVKFRNIRESNILLDIFLNSLDVFEPELTTFLIKKNTEYKYIIDAGSNTGILSACAEIGFPEASILSIEPVKINYEYILEFKKINNFKFKVINCCLGNTCGNAKMYIPHGSGSSKISATASLINSFRGTNHIYNHLEFREENVKMHKLDFILNKHFNEKFYVNGNTLIKLDCEGAELDIIKSSKALDKNNIDFIIEIMIGDKDKQVIFDLLIEKGFDAYLMTPASLIKEDRPLTLPNKSITNRTIWRNHYFTKKSIAEVKEISINTYGNWI